MAQQQRQRNSTGSAFLWGGVFGAGAVIVALLGRFILVGRLTRGLRVAVRPVAGATLISILLALAVVACYFLAGLLAARRAGRIEPGIFAGLIAGSIAGLGTLALAFIGVGLTRRGVHTNAVMGGGIAARQLATVALMPSLVRMLTSVAVGAGLGALGALVGHPRGNTTGADGGYAYQVGAVGYTPGTGYSAPTPPPHGYPTSEETPTVQSESTPPTV